MMANAASTPVVGFHTWWVAIRPKTLPAAVAPVLVGAAVAYREDGFHGAVAAVALVVALLLQVVANLANDLFDFYRGADAHRTGPTRVTQAGLVSPAQMKRATALAVALAVLGGLYLVWHGGWPILVLGGLAILAAVAYTAGPLPLGYNGLGEVFVFLFFGLVGVAGTAYLQTGQLTGLSLGASIPVGLLVTAVIVVNNLRDLETDRQAGKKTVAVRVGRKATILEYRALVLVSFLLPAAIALIGNAGPVVLLPFLSLPLALPLLRSIALEHGRALNPVLAGTARLALVFSALFAIGLVL